MRMLLLFPVALALGACAQVTDVARGTIHPLANHYCAEVAPELREAARLSLGTTDEGHKITIECADPKAPVAE